MKHKGLLIWITVFFLLINTSYFWESELGFFAMLAGILLGISFILLTIQFFVQIYFYIREKFRDKYRLIAGVYIAIVLTLTTFFSSGFINFDRLFHGDDVLVAQREGAANCTTTLKLKENSTFTETVVCFGMWRVEGTYFFKGDTIFFDYKSRNEGRIDHYKFGVVEGQKGEEYKGNLVRYRDDSDTVGFELWIVKNELIK